MKFFTSCLKWMMVQRRRERSDQYVEDFETDAGDFTVDDKP